MELAFDLFYSSQARPIIPSPSSPSDRGALAALRASEWNMELAFDLFYSSSTSGQQLRALGRSAAPKVDPRQLEHLFLRYKVVHAGMSFVSDVIPRIHLCLLFTPSNPYCGHKNWNDFEAPQSTPSPSPHTPFLSLSLSMVSFPCGRQVDPQDIVMVSAGYAAQRQALI
ncbi:unnamed protein product [Closterium sp. NIES-65]|nr:unnamed protein product [Closterium sp. NIES-65]